MTDKTFKEEIYFDFEIVKSKIDREKSELKELEKLTNLNLLIQFLIIGEDRRFYRHIGFDIIAIFRAIRNRILYNKREGASTIEQQLIRVLTNQFEKSYRRKLKEIILATKLKRLLSKKQIALLYLKLAYYGTEKQGLEQVLSSYNLKSSDYLSIEICAGIVARLKYPEPLANNSFKLKQIEKRMKHILKLYK